MNDIETQLKNLPHFQADSLFKDKLKRRVMRESHSSSQFWSWLPRIATVTAAVIVIIAGSLYLRVKQQLPGSERSALELFQAAPVSAAEIIRRSLTKYFASSTIYHAKVTQFFSGGPYATYEEWDDLDSDMFYEEISYPDGRNVIQGFNREFRWNIDFTAKTIHKDIYIYDSPFTDQPVAVQTDLSRVFSDLLEYGVLTAVEDSLDGRSVYAIRDTRTGPEKLWDVLYFDRETFAVIRTDNYGTDGRIQDSVIYELQESLSRSEEAVVRIFSFKKPTEEFSIYERHFSVSKSYQDEYTLVEGPPLPSPQPIFGGLASPEATSSATPQP